MKRFSVVLINCLLIAAVSLGVIFYADRETKAENVRSETKFADTAAILEEIANNYLQDSQSVADRWAALIDGTDFTMESAIAMLQEMTLEEGASAQLVWADSMTGMATEPKAADPDDYTVDYSRSNLQTVLTEVDTEGALHMTHRYSNPQTGAYAVGFCSAVTLTDEEGVQQDAVLMYVVPITLLEQRWTFPTEYGDDASVALINLEGEYIIKPGSMKNEDFFSYVYSYNKGVIDEAALQEEMSTETSGSFTASDAAGEECLWVYTRLGNDSDLILVSVIPTATLQNGRTDWTTSLIIVAALGLLLIFDMIYVHGERVKDQNAHEAAQAQSAIIGALAKNYSNVFVVRPQQDRADIIKLEGYVTAEITRQTKTFVYSQIVGNYIRDRVHPEDKEDMRAYMDAEQLTKLLEQNDDLDYSYRILVDGETHYFNMHAVRISEAGEQLRAVVGYRNIDTIVADQEKSRKVLEDALNAAQHANRAKTTFLNSMSHDIRTPMNAIIGFTSLAATHINNTELVKDYLKKIQVSSNHLLSLINDVLDMSRIESGKVKIEEKEAHLPDILHDLRTIVQSDIKANQLDLFIDTMDVEDEDIICDRLRLNQVLLNIVSNAIKFTGPGGHISVRITQNADAPEGYAAYSFSIKDTGIGMSEEFLEHIFEPFTRAQTATVSGIQGSGLGMAITKNIVDMMGGKIEVKSEEGVGSEFIVSFSFRKSGNKVVYKPIPELTGSPALVVDDDMDCCISVCKMLAEIGMRPEWTSSGREAVVRTQYAFERSDPFAVYVVDWLMPDMNGIETVRRIRSIIGDDKPIIVLTSYDWGDIEAEAREAGVTHFVSKPIFMSELRQVLEQPFAVPAPKQPEEEEKPDFTGAKLLLVEDNELNREIAVDILEEAGFAVDTAEDGSVAVEIMRTFTGQYDLILMDIQMPIMDGYEATRQIRALPNEAAAQIPIVAMTANAFEEDKQLAFEAGMNGHVAKPINVPQLMQTLAEVLHKS